MKKILTIILTLAIALSLTACNSDTPDQSTPNTATGGDSTTISTRTISAPSTTSGNTPPTAQSTTAASTPTTAPVTATSTPTSAAPTTTTSVPTPPQSPSPQEIQEIDAQLQGTWTVNVSVVNATYIFDEGKVAVEAVVSGISEGINTGNYKIGKDDLGNEKILFTYDSGVEADLTYNFEDETLELLFYGGNAFYVMEKVSDSTDTSQLGTFWDFEYFVDDFNLPTDEVYIKNKHDLIGTFTNSATTGSEVSVQFMVYTYESNLEIAMMLYEYGRYPMVNSSDRNIVEYDILMRTPDGSTHELTGTMYEGGDRIFVDLDHQQAVINALSGDGEIMFRITQSDRTTTSYLFTVEASNFADIYQEKITTQ